MKSSQARLTLFSAFCILLCVALDGQGRNEKVVEETDLQVVLELADGSRLIGTPGVKKLALRTPYAQMDIPLLLIEEIVCIPDEEWVSVCLQNGDRLSGFLKLPSMQIHGAVGRVTVAMEKVSRISILSGDGDASGRSFDGTERGIRIPPGTLVTQGKPGGKVEQFPQPVQSCTWMFWMRTRQTVGGAILFKADPRDERHFYCGINDTYPDRPGKLTWVERSRGGDFKWTTQKTITDGRWHHIALVRNLDDRSLRFCVDGDWEPEGNNSGMWEISNERPLLVGEDYQGGSRFRGDLRDLRYYQIALGLEEVRRAMKGRLAATACYIVPLGKRGPLPALERD
jgi:hypothetical protein